MLRSKNTTFVLLERGEEDRALVGELKDIERLVGMSIGARDFYMRFPGLVKLRQGLEDELRDSE